MKKLIFASVTAAVMGLALHVTYAAGPSELASGAPAAVCGAGYKAEKVSFVGAEKALRSYTCTKTIPDQRPCAKFMNRDDAPIDVNGHTLKLSYVCAVPPG